MLISGIDFPVPLLTALRDRRLVVFAGAGVSMGHPAGLPGFRDLARQIAAGTTLTIGDNEAEDQFLSRLKAAGPDVHQRAAQLLQSDGVPSTELHRNLLRLYSKPEDVRIVTTNFDPLFEQAADGLFNTAPRVFYAPALPVGRRFRGIAHVHGAVHVPAEMVLTSEDFGRAYLTEGWARRFLVDLFLNETVLFVGYSHNDTIMSYLTPAVPRHGDNPRYALIGETDDTPERWTALGINPIRFPQPKSGDYSLLVDAIDNLARHVERGFLGWRDAITQISGVAPPVDAESGETIEYALTDPVLTRFFTDVAESPDWIDWLDQRNHLSAMFADGNLNEQNIRLAYWLANRFATKHADMLFAAIRRHDARLNPDFWHMLGDRVGQADPDTADTTTLTRWVHFLMDNIPWQINEFTLLDIAKICAKVAVISPVIKIYDAISAVHNRPLARGSEIWASAGMDTYAMRQLWEECLKPYLPAIAESLLERTAKRLDERHTMLQAWGHASDTWDSDSFGRYAIEPHEQDDFPENCHVLIDIARDCLEYLAVNRPDAARLWAERYAGSPAPLLRRLAVYALSALTNLSADDKIAWILAHCNIHETAARHELFVAAKAAYPQAGPEQRGNLIQEILAYRWPDKTDSDRDRRSAHYHYTWLRWLNEAAPDDALTVRHLAAIRGKYPDFELPERPDFTHYWSGFAPVHGKPSPWSTSDLLSVSPDEWLPLALAQNLDDDEVAPRHQLLDNIARATRQNPGWGARIAALMTQAGQWDTPVWTGIIEGWTFAASLECTPICSIGLPTARGTNGLPGFSLTATPIPGAFSPSALAISSELRMKLGKGILGTPGLKAIGKTACPVSPRRWTKARSAL